jgi:phosphatidylglycerol:prolipoprotein diacylglycerol transferase
MSTHGLLLGGVTGTAIFSWLYRRPLLVLTDVLAVPAAIIMGAGRLGNFIDGQIVGGLTDAWWAVKFPDAEGFRHPVVLYDGVKNLLLVPLLIYARRRHPPPGGATGLFLFLYASLRIFVDLFREYSTTLLGLTTGQSLNLSFAALGLGLMVWAARGRTGPVTSAASDDVPTPAGGLLWRRLVFAAILLFSLTLPSDWTQDVPVRYGKRHPGLRHSTIYPALEMTPPVGGASVP